MPITLPPDTVWARRTDLEAGVDFVKGGQTNSDKPNVILSDASGQMIVIYGRCGNVVHAYKAHTYQVPDSTVIEDSTGAAELTIVRTAIDTALVKAMAADAVAAVAKKDTFVLNKPQPMVAREQKSVVFIEHREPNPYITPYEWNQTANDVLIFTATIAYVYLIYRSIPSWRFMFQGIKAMF